MKIGYINDKLAAPGTNLAETISQAVINEISSQKISKDDIAKIIGKSTSFVYKVSQNKLSFDFDDLAKIGAETNIPVLKIITSVYSQIPDLTKDESDANNEMIKFYQEIEQNLSEIDSLDFEIEEEHSDIDWDSITNEENTSDDSVNAGIVALMNDLLNAPNKDKIKFIRGIRKDKQLNGYLKKSISLNTNGSTKGKSKKRCANNIIRKHAL